MNLNDLYRAVARTGLEIDPMGGFEVKSENVLLLNRNLIAVQEERDEFDKMFNKDFFQED